MKKYEADVVIVGGGPAGAVSAIAAGRNGADVLLVEQYGQLGGMSTVGGVHPWMTFHDKQGKQTIFGIAQEIVDELVKSGDSRGHVSDTMGETSTVTPFNPEALKYLLVKMCLDAGVKILFHTFVFAVETQNRKIVKLKAANKEGEIEIYGRNYIDATGDGDIAYYAGCEYEKGREEDGMMQPATMNFTMGNVDFEKIRRFMLENKEDFHFNSRFDELEHDLPNGFSGFFKEWEKGCKELGIDISRDRVLAFRGYRDDIATINTTRVLGIDSTKAEDLSRGELEGRKQIMEVEKLLRNYIPGFENAYMISSAAVIGIRESRRIKGRETITLEDLQKGNMPEDRIAVNAYTVDVHQPDGKSFIQYEVPAYGIPYGSMLPEEMDNLIVAGRCISCTREAQGSIRVTPSCMAMGQAAGTAAAMACRNDVNVCDIEIDKLQEKLLEDNVYLG